jgi:myosin heavy subunit
MHDDEVDTFLESMRKLAKEDSDLVKLFKGNDEDRERVNNEKSQMKLWRSKISDKMTDLRDLSRMTEELKALEKDQTSLEADISALRTSQKNKQSILDDAELEDNELKDILDCSRSWLGDANRISDQKMKIQQRRSDIRSAAPIGQDRDLRTVEREVSDQAENTDRIMNEINALNKEATRLNTTNANLQNEVSTILGMEL